MYSTFYLKDIDPRPKTHVCTKCAREVEAGKRCICIPSQPTKPSQKDDKK